MQVNSSVDALLFCEPTTYDHNIFSKYIIGADVSHLPFQLVKPSSFRKRTSKKGGVRGPYRRYSSEEKLEIIQRVHYL